MKQMGLQTRDKTDANEVLGVGVPASASRSGAALLQAMVGAMTCMHLAACSDSDGTSVSGALSDTGIRGEALLSIAAEVALPTYEEFLDAAQDLETSTASLQQAVETSTEEMAEAARSEAQQAFLDAITVWQRAELMQFGPAGVMNLTPGGEDLRDEIYSWPLVNRCVVDQVLTEQSYANAQLFSVLAINAHGLDVLEYLLFVDEPESSDNACDSDDRINRDGLWAALSAAELRLRRASYAAVEAKRIREYAETLVERWDPHFLDQLRLAGNQNRVYATAQEGLNAISDALFYLDKESKDMKLADPSGISTVCPGELCPELRESDFADQSLAHIEANLQGFRDVFAGSESGIGFEELLQAEGSNDVASAMLEAIDGAIAHVQGLEDSMLLELQKDPDQVRLAHSLVQAVTDELKTRFITVLDLEIPNRAEGDND
ncbi:MAG: imelysin family protein [Myxococcota bacterium]